MTPTLALGQFVTALLVVAFLFISVVLILVVLVQRPQGGGLSGAFGGASAGSSQTAFGARTGDALTIITIGIFLAFLGMAIGLNYVVGPPTATANPTAGAAPPGTQPTSTPLSTTPGNPPAGGETTPPPAGGEGETTAPEEGGESTPIENIEEIVPEEAGESGEETTEPPADGGETTGGGA